MYSKLVVLQVITVGVLFVLAVMKHHQGIRLPKRGAVVVYFLFVISLIPSCFLAASQALAWAAFAKIMQFFLLFLFAWILLSQHNFRNVFLRSLIVFVWGALLVAFFQFLLLYSNGWSEAWLIRAQTWFGVFPESSDLHQQSYFIKSLFANRNLFAQLLVLTAPFLAYAVFVERRLWRVLALTALLLSILPAVFLFVRSVWYVGGAVAALGIVLWIGMLNRNKRLQSRALVVTFVLLLAGSVSFMLGQRVSSVKETIEKQGYWTSNVNFGSVNERLHLWEATIPMIQDHALSGVGPGNWSVVFPAYYQSELREVSSGTYTQFQRVHNDYLQLFAEYGLVSALLFVVVLLWAFFFRVWVLLRTADEKERLWSLSLLLFLLSYAGFSLVSFPHERVEHQFLLALVLAFSFAKVKSGFELKEWYIHSPRWVYLTLFMLTLPLAAHSLLLLRSDVYMKEAYAARLSGHADQYQYFEAARNTFCTIDPNGTPLDWYIAYQYTASGNLHMAKRHLLKARDAHPNHKHVYNDLAYVFANQKGSEQAIPFYKKALELSPGFTDANVNMAILEVKQQHYDSAWFYLSRCDTLNTHTAYHDVLRETCGRIAWELRSTLEGRDSLLELTIERIASNQGWMWEVHKHAIQNNVNFRQQLIEESVYVLHELDKQIDETKAQYIRNQLKKDL